MHAVMIQGQETGLRLPPAPEFGSDGTWPPEVTEWVTLRWQLFDAKNSSIDAAATYTALRFLWHPNNDNPMFTADALKEDFLREFFRFVPRGISVSDLSRDGSVTVRLRDWALADRHFLPGKRCGSNSPELRRLVHSVRWRRKDPVIKLPPGAAHEVTHSLTTGLSAEHSSILADSLGITLGGTAAGAQAKLSSTLQREFGGRVP
jgi:hypothetical protein